MLHCGGAKKTMFNKSHCVWTFYLFRSPQYFPSSDRNGHILTSKSAAAFCCDCWEVWAHFNNKTGPRNQRRSLGSDLSSAAPAPSLHSPGPPSSRPGNAPPSQRRDGWRGSSSRPSGPPRLGRKTGGGSERAEVSEEPAGGPSVPSVSPDPNRWVTSRVSVCFRWNSTSFTASRVWLSCFWGVRRPPRSNRDSSSPLRTPEKSWGGAEVTVREVLLRIRVRIQQPLRGYWQIHRQENDPQHFMWRRTRCTSEKINTYSP